MITYWNTRKSFSLYHSEQSKKLENKQEDWLELFYPSNSLFSFSVFMMQIPLAIELPNNGELGEKGEFME